MKTDYFTAWLNLLAALIILAQAFLNLYHFRKTKGRMASSLVIVLVVSGLVLGSLFLLGYVMLDRNLIMCGGC